MQKRSELEWGKKWRGFGLAVAQPGHMQTIGTLFQRDNHADTSSLDFYRQDALPGVLPTLSSKLKPEIVLVGSSCQPVSGQLATHPSNTNKLNIDWKFYSK